MELLQRFFEIENEMRAVQIYMDLVYDCRRAVREYDVDCLSGYGHKYQCGYEDTYDEHVPVQLSQSLCGRVKSADTDNAAVMTVLMEGRAPPWKCTYWQ